MLATSLNELGYQPILALILVIMALGGTIMLITHVLPKPGRQGPRKDSTYEAGMEVIGDARRRFNVRFYLVAMLFLLFDVELIFMYPWAKVFTAGAAQGANSGANMSFLFYEMVIFMVILLVGYVYAWRKGVFRWD